MFIRKGFFNFRAETLIQLSVYIILAVWFTSKADSGMRQMSVSVVKLTEITDWLHTFAVNSDTWHSASMGTEFYQGKPRSDSFTMDNYNQKLLNQLSDQLRGKKWRS